jgi:hypothetical protein
MDATPRGQAWALEELVDIIGQILYQVDFDQCDFELDNSPGSGIVELTLTVMKGKEW